MLFYILKCAGSYYKANENRVTIKRSHSTKLATRPKGALNATIEDSFMEGTKFHFTEIQLTKLD